MNVFGTNKHWVGFVLLGHFCITKLVQNFAYEAKVPGDFYRAFMKFHPHFFRFDWNLKVLLNTNNSFRTKMRNFRLYSVYYF